MGRRSFDKKNATKSLIHPNIGPFGHVLFLYSKVDGGRDGDGGYLTCQLISRVRIKLSDAM